MFARIISLTALLFLLGSCGDGGAADSGVDTVKTFRKKDGGQAKGTQKSTAEVSGKSKEEILAAKVAQRLEKKYHDAKEGWQREEVLREIGEQLGARGKSLRKLVRGACQDEDPEIRMAALEVLAVVDSEGCKETLIAGLSDEEDAVQIAAIKAWRKAKIQDVQPLIKRLADEFDPEKLTALALVVKEFAPAFQAPAIGKLMPEIPSLPAIRHLVEFIEKHKAVSQALVVAQFLDRDDRLLRLTSARTLGVLGLKAKPVFDALCGALEDEDEEVRRAAVSSLRSLSGKNFGYDPKASKATRVASAKKWQAWVAAHPGG